MNTQKWLSKNTADMTGKTVAITGATGGLGKALCKHLAALGAEILMLNRDLKKSQSLKEELLTEFPNTKVEIVKLDLGSLQNVKEACEELQNRQLDFLVLNAGVYKIPLVQTELGYNNVFQVNFLSHYRLVKGLLPNLRKAKAKVVVVGSIAYKSAKLKEADVDYSHKKSAMKTYGNAKRFLMFSLAELLKDEPDVGFAIAHPGVTFTNMTTHYHKAVNWFVKWGVKAFFPSPEQAALNLVWALFENCPYMRWIGPKHLEVWGKPTVKKLKKCTAKESAKIFELAENIDRQIAD